MKVDAGSFEVIYMDGPAGVGSVGGDIFLQGGGPYEGLVADITREVDDDVCLVDAVGIYQFWPDRRGSKARQVPKEYIRVSYLFRYLSCFSPGHQGHIQVSLVTVMPLPL